MGLIKAAFGAAGGVLADQWKEYFYCDSLDADVLVAKGQKRSDRRSSNRRGSDNIITNGSLIAVNEGQCMIIVEQGKVVELCAEPGEFTYDTSTEPSIFYGGLGKGIADSFSTIGKRFTFGGDTARDQRVYYFNTKEIMGNKYGTPGAVPFRVVDRNVGLDIDIGVRCHGEYSYRITNPMLFYTNVCGNIEDDYTRDEIDAQLKSEFLGALQPAFAKVSEMGVRYSALPGHTAEFCDALNRTLGAKWVETRGISISSIGVSSVKASEEDEAMIKELQRNAALRDPSMAAAHLVGSQSSAMQNAAKNEGGAMNGFIGMNMAGGAMGGTVGSLFAMGAENEEKKRAAAIWKCSCGAENDGGKFCAECGKPKENGWVCACGKLNKGKFCSECGAKKPAGALTYKCDKCGFEPEDPADPPKFCPECGDRFDEEDAK